MAAMKIMLVDDEPDFVEVTQTLLESHSFDVVTAHSGAEARQKAPEEKPDLIILDVMMETRTEGFDVARWLREREDTGRIPIIMLTAVNQEVPWRFEPDEMWLPVDTFLDKPVSPERLLGEVKKVAQHVEAEEQ